MVMEGLRAKFARLLWPRAHQSC